MAAVEPVRTWTYDDLCRLPNDRRYEIIAGVLYEMPSPTPLHQIIVMRLVRLLLPSVDRLAGLLLWAPLDVFLPDADPVQPDLFMLSEGKKGLISERGVEGAPDLVIEILSPSNARHDRVLKRELYARSGVQEYWLVSPEAATVEVLTLEADHYGIHVLAGEDQLVRSVLLPDLSFPASSMFEPALGSQW